MKGNGETCTVFTGSSSSSSSSSSNYKSLFWGTKFASNWNQAVSVMTSPLPYIDPVSQWIPGLFVSFSTFFNIPVNFYLSFPQGLLHY